MFERLVEERLRHDRPPLLRVDGADITAAQVRSALAGCATRLQDCPNWINQCADPARFLVALLACQLSGKRTLLWPRDLNAEGLGSEYRGAQCIVDELVDFRHDDGSDALVISQNATSSSVLAFTSGSTGTPTPHSKDAAALATIASIIRQALPAEARGPGNLITTVPSGHMYGLEWNILLPLATDLTLCNAPTFYPRDLAHAIEVLDGARVLITTPVHLRAIVRSKLKFGKVDWIVSATAPLDEQLAAECARQFNAKILEIYGCTESGTAAARNPLERSEWQLLDAFSMTEIDGRTRVDAKHLPLAVDLQDRINHIDDRRFELLGRDADLVKVGGRRASLSGLTQQLLSIPGVEDAVLHFDERTDRLRAAVVASGLSSDEIRRMLRTRIDAIFLPRPLRVVPALPRSATGKLRREALDRLFAS